MKFSGTDTVTFSWDVPIYVFAIDLRDLGTNGPTDLVVTIKSRDGSKRVITVYSNYTGVSGNTLFLGLLDDEGIASISITTTTAGDGIYVDRLQTLPAPEPAASAVAGASPAIPRSVAGVAVSPGVSTATYGAAGVSVGAAAGMLVSIAGVAGCSVVVVASAAGSAS
jgi:hypothetical protein